MSLASPRLRSLVASLATFPSVSLIPFAPLKLARCPHSLITSLATLPSMSLIPFAPFASRQPLLQQSSRHGYRYRIRTVRVCLAFFCLAVVPSEQGDFRHPFADASHPFEHY